MDTKVSLSLAESLAVPRPGKVSALIRDIDSARRVPTGLPNLDNPIDGPKELFFSADELRRADLGVTVTKNIIFSGEGGRYNLAFEAVNAGWTRQVGIAFPNTVRGDSPLIALSRNPSQEEVFWIGADSDVSSNWRNDNVDSGKWHEQFGIAFPNTVRGDSPLIALSRNQLPH